MLYFLDTEFIEDGKTIDLVSIGIAAEDGRTYYAISSEFDASRANEWVKANVLSKLPPNDSDEEDVKPIWKSRQEIRDDVFRFVGSGKHQFWGYYADYDWVVFCWLFGTMMDLPTGWPMYCRDLKQLLDDRGNPKVPFEPGQEHHALSDALWNKRVYEWVATLSATA